MPFPKWRIKYIWFSLSQYNFLFWISFVFFLYFSYLKLAHLKWTLGDTKLSQGLSLAVYKGFKGWLFFQLLFLVSLNIHFFSLQMYIDWHFQRTMHEFQIPFLSINTLFRAITVYISLEIFSSTCSQFTVDFICSFITISFSALKYYYFTSWSVASGFDYFKLEEQRPQCRFLRIISWLRLFCPLFVFQQAVIDEENHLSYAIAAYHVWP